MLFCPSGFAFSGEITDPPIAQTFDITGTDSATGVLRVSVTTDASDPFAGEVRVYFASTATGPYITMYFSFNEVSELFKIPSDTTHLTVTGTAAAVFTLTTGQMI